MARPKIKIDDAEVEKLASFGLTNTELADFFGCGESTIRERFAANVKKGRSNLKARLRTKQIQEALNGNTALLIFLGKTYLGQTERQEIVTHTVESVEKQLENIFKGAVHGS